MVELLLSKLLECPSSGIMLSAHLTLRSIAADINSAGDTAAAAAATAAAAAAALFSSCAIVLFGTQVYCCHFAIGYCCHFHFCGALIGIGSKPKSVVV
jgi:hypothetical protein